MLKEERARGEAVRHTRPSIIEGRRTILPPIVLPVAFLYAGLLEIAVYYFSKWAFVVGFLAGAVVLLLFLGILSVCKADEAGNKRSFEKHLFRGSLFVRVVAVCVLLCAFELYTGSPFEVGFGKDDYAYHRLATTLAQSWHSGLPFYSPLGHFYSGYVYFVAFFYYLFGAHTIIARLLNAIVGSLVVVLVYRIAHLVWNEAVGRIAGYIAMLFPHLLYYSATQHKDIVLTLLVLGVIHRTILLINSDRLSVVDVAAILSGCFLLIFFRLALFVQLLGLTVFVLIWYVMRSHRIRFSNLVVLAVLVVATASVIYVSEQSFGVGQAFEYRLGMQRTSTWMLQSSSYSSWLNFPVFVSVSFFVPFPSLFHSLQPDGYPSSGIYKVGLALAWNFLSFFSLLGIIHASKYVKRFASRRFAGRIYLISFALLYLGGMAWGGNVFSDRQRLVTVPVLVMFAASGLKGYNRRQPILYLLYVSVMFAMTLAMNYIRASGRGWV